MNSFKEQCIALRKKDKTLDEIVTITGRSKTSVWFHIKNISLTENKRNEILKNTAKRALALSSARKGKSKRKFKEFEAWTPDIVLLIAHLLFDGELSRARCSYNNRSEALIYRVEKLFQYIYAYEPKRYDNLKTGVHKISYNNIALTNYLRHKSSQLLVEVSTLPKSCQREFLRAFFDDEGCMDYRPVRKVRQIRGYQNDRDILKIIKTLLQNFGIESKIKNPNEVVINGKENLIKFQKEINFSKGVSPNPNRTNALRKDSIEKRELLDQAIKSFKT